MFKYLYKSQAWTSGSETHSHGRVSKVANEKLFFHRLHIFYVMHVFPIFVDSFIVPPFPSAAKHIFPPLQRFHRTE